MGGSRSLAVRRLLARMNDVTIALDYAPGVDEFGAGAIGVKRVATLEEKQHWYGAFLWICDEKRKKRGKAFYLFQDRFKEKPPWSWQTCVKPVPPSLEQRNFVRSRDIAFAKSRARYE